MTAASWLRWLGAMGVATSVLAASPTFGQGKAAGTKKGAVLAKADAAALEEAERLTQDSDKLYDEGKYDEALQAAERALSIRERVLGPDHSDVAQSLGQLAGMCAEKGDDARAEALFQRALAVGEKALGPEHTGLATILSGLAGLYTDRGDYDRAEALYRRVLAIREKAFGAEHPEVAFVLNDLALLYDWKADYAKAEPLYQRALAIREKVLGPDHPDFATSLNNLAALYATKGDYVKAEPLFRRAVAIREKAVGPDDPSMASALNNLAWLHVAEGNYADAEELYRRAISLKEKALGPEHPRMARTLINLAALYVKRRDFAKAEPLYQRAVSIQEKALGPEHSELAYSLRGLAWMYDANGDDAKAEPLYQRALSIQEKALGPEHPEVAESLNGLASLYFRKADYATAELLHQRALAIREKVLGPQHPAVAQSLNGLAWLYLGRGNAPEALRRMRQAAAIEDHNAVVVLDTGSEEQKRAYMATLRESTDSEVSLHVQYAPGTEDAGRFALTAILRRKGRVLDAVANSFAALRRHVTPADEVLFDELQAVSTYYSNLVWRGPDKMPLDQYHATLADLGEKEQDIEGRLSRRSAELQGELRPITLEQVQAAIPEGAALVEIFRYKPFDAAQARRREPWGKPRYVGYVLRHRGGPSFADLGEAVRIDEAVRKVRTAFADFDLTHDPKAAARALDALVMQPIRKLLGDTHWVFLSPDGPLNLVPFAALVDDEGRYLVERYLFTYLTSGRDLLRFQAPAKPAQDPLVLADPAFDKAQGQNPERKEETHRGLRSADMSLIRFSPLPGTAGEARAIRQRLQGGAAVLLGAKAAESVVKASHGPRILHIATHGFFLPDQDDSNDPSASSAQPAAFGSELRPDIAAAVQRENPLLRSGLGLAGANARAGGGSDDGILTALEVSGLDLYGTKLVVLSACETGVGAAISGEGVYGLRRSFAIAGAETQVMSLWQVDSGVTREMMLAYYDKLAQGAGRSEAMRQVQLEMLGRDDRGHPNLWASFIVSGDPAALDGKPVVPDFAKVAPGARGCACRHAGGEAGKPPAGALGLAALMMLAVARLLGRSTLRCRVTSWARSRPAGRFRCSGAALYQVERSAGAVTRFERNARRRTPFLLSTIWPLARRNPFGWRARLDERHPER